MTCPSTGDGVNNLTNYAAFSQLPQRSSEPSEILVASAEADQEGMKANIRIAFRHLEGAVIALGKAIQAHDGGTSSTGQNK